MAAHTSRPVFEHLEVVETGRRRRWTEDEKLRIVAESLSGRRLVSSTARRYGISRSLLRCGVGSFRYSLCLAGSRVRVRSGSGPPGGPGQRAAGAYRRGRMEIVVSCDRRIIVDAGVDVAALARVLDLLSRR